MKNTSQVILGIDPGYGIIGFGVIEVKNGQAKILTYGAIRTPANIDFPQRLKILSDDLKVLIKKYKPDKAGVEKLYFQNNAKTAIDVGQARGVILLTLVEAGIPTIELTPLQVKMGVTGYGKADKGQIQKMVKSILNLKSIPKPDDAADALAIALSVINEKYS